MKFILVGGSLATGKSTLAKQLQQQTGFKRVSMDEIKEALFDAGGYRDRAWSKEIGRLAWPVFQRLVEMHLGRGDSIIAEATFLHPGDAGWIGSVALRVRATVYQVWVTADSGVCRERFIRRMQTERHPGHNDSLETVLEEFDQRYFRSGIIFQPLVVSGQTLVVDTTDFASVDLEKIVRFVKDEEFS